MHHPRDRIVWTKAFDNSVVEHRVEREIAQRVYNEESIRRPIGHMVKNHLDSERENPLLPHGLLFPISSKGSFICTIPHTG